MINSLKTEFFKQFFVLFVNNLQRIVYMYTVSLIFQVLGLYILYLKFRVVRNTHVEKFIFYFSFLFYFSMTHFLIWFLFSMESFELSYEFHNNKLLILKRTLDKIFEDYPHVWYIDSQGFSFEKKLDFRFYSEDMMSNDSIPEKYGITEIKKANFDEFIEAVYKDTTFANLIKMHVTRGDSLRYRKVSLIETWKNPHDKNSETYVYSYYTNNVISSLHRKEYPFNINIAESKLQSSEAYMQAWNLKIPQSVKTYLSNVITSLQNFILKVFFMFILENFSRNQT